MCHSNGRVCASIYQALAHFVGVCLQFDFVELLDGRRLLAQDVRGLEGPVAMQRSLIPITTHDTGFIKYMDSGIWHLAIYNDGKETETVSFLTSAIGERPLLKKTKQNKKTLPPFTGTSHTIPIEASGRVSRPQTFFWWEGESDTVVGAFKLVEKKGG